MQIETFEVEEINSSEAATMAADSESIALCEKLGLKGQLNLTDKETDTRCPYRKMTALEEIVYETLFTGQTPVEDYSSGLIPLRVLQVFAHAKEVPMFKGFIVLHPADRKMRDPVLVAYTGTSYAWNPVEKFILARWGEALEPFEKLVEKAKVAWIAKRKVELSEALHRVQSAVDNIAHEATEFFITGEKKTEQIFL